MRLEIPGLKTSGRMLAVVIIAVTVPVSGEIITVPADYPTIQAAIDAASTGDEVVVAAGTYNETIDFLGKPITVRSADGPEATVLDGSWPVNLDDTLVRCVSGEGPETVLEGFTITGGAGELLPNGMRAGGGMLINHGSSPIIRNCTFTDNILGSATSGAYGGGIACGNSSDPLIIACTFRDNVAGTDLKSKSFGGGLYCAFASPSISDCVFIDNRAWTGGGVCVHPGSPPIRDCLFIGNWAASGGGGLYSAGVVSSPAITNCVFRDNVAAGPEWSQGGGGILCYLGNTTISNCTVTGNSAVGEGGGISIIGNNAEGSIVGCTIVGNTARNGGGVFAFNDRVTINNSVIANNSASEAAGGISAVWLVTLRLVNCTIAGNTAPFGAGVGLDSDGGPSNALMTNCILWNTGDEVWNNDGSAVAITFSDVRGGWPGEGNIDTNPLFISEPDAGLDGTWGTEDDDTGDLRLASGSACIDAGDNLAVADDITTDVNGHPRFVDDPDTTDTGRGQAPIVDIGACEFQGTACVADVTGDGVAGVQDLVQIILNWGGGGEADITGDGVVDVQDLTALVLGWGLCV